MPKKAFLPIFFFICSLRAQVSINIGDNLQSMADANPNNTHFIIHAGTHLAAHSIRIFKCENIAGERI